MPAVFPFRAVQFRAGRGDVSTVVAPPYDVLDSTARNALLALDRHNIVAIDLPHTPAKELGPPQAYETAANLYRAWLGEGALVRRPQPAMFAYRHSFQFRGKRYQRCGMACTVETVPFGPRNGGGILPHEQTFSGPKEDRLALMKATRTQTSPIFGLHQDAQGKATAILHKAMASRSPDMTAKMSDGWPHEVWSIDDEATIKAYADALAGEDIFIADGHHRYNTALNYLQHLESQGPVPADHAARRCMMVLVGMSDPGLAIGPTHRVLGGMEGYSFEAFKEATRGILEIATIGKDPNLIEPAMEKAADALAARGGGNVFGLLDFATGQCAVATLVAPDPLAARFGGKPDAWRRLDVALIQHLLVEEVCQPRLNGGRPITWAFPHSVKEVVEIGKGRETGAGGGAGFAQLAIIVRPTPLESVRAVSAASELMPQKSTFFYPKLATGLFLNPLE
jgi:uncharacterized protein (DUF1015 family)